MDKVVWIGLILYEVVLAVILIVFSFWYQAQPDYQMLENMPLVQRVAPMLMGVLFLLMLAPAFSVFHDGE